MCLFLQTQNFQQITSALVTDMHASSSAANASLVRIRSDLKTQAQAVAQSLTALAQLQQVQVEVRTAVHAGLREVEAIGEMSRGLQHSMHRSLNMTVSNTIGVLRVRSLGSRELFNRMDSSCCVCTKVSLCMCSTRESWQAGCTPRSKIESIQQHLSDIVRAFAACGGYIGSPWRASRTTDAEVG